MTTFIISLIILFLGYFFYSKFVEKVFGADPNRQTPAYRLEDGVDYMPMNTAKVYLIQFLNIAGLGPIFGAILGASYGPVAFIWIVLGAIFAGAVHDYFSGMLSLRQDGQSIGEVIGKWLGMSARQVGRFVTIFLMILVGAAFMTGPAKILSTSYGMNVNFWVALIFIYYFLATLLPIDKIIGRFYPVFGLALLFMAIGVGGAMIVKGANIPELSLANLHNMHPDAQKYPIFPLLFVTISCGALSGFHSTQSPLMARTIKNEKLGRKVFYGAMITEAVVALIWAAAAMSYYGSVDGLHGALAKYSQNAAPVVHEITNGWLGKVGGLLAVLGVVAAPITTGDTAFRSARLIVSDFTKVKQNKWQNRLLISIPIFAIAFLLTQSRFDILWRYMFWTNQLLAGLVLWAVTVYLGKAHKLYWITLVPAAFITSVVISYILVAPEGFRLNFVIGDTIAIVITMVLVLVFLYYRYKVWNRMAPVVA